MLPVAGRVCPKKEDRILSTRESQYGQRSHKKYWARRGATGWLFRVGAKPAERPRRTPLLQRGRHKWLAACVGGFLRFAPSGEKPRHFLQHKKSPPIAGGLLGTQKGLFPVSFRRVLAVDAVAGKRQRFDAFFGDRLAAVFTNAVNAFVYFAQRRFNLFNGAVRIAGKLK